MKNVIILLKNQKQLKEERLKTAHYPKEIEHIVKQDVKDIDKAIQILSERFKDTKASVKHETKQLNILDVSESAYVMMIDTEPTIVMADNIASAMDVADEIGSSFYEMIYHRSLKVLHSR